MRRTAVTATILDLARSWSRSLRAARRSSKTVTTYMEAVNGLVAEVSAIRREHVEAFIGDLLAAWKPTTAANRYKSLRVFFNWCVEEGEITASPMARMRPPSLGSPRMRVLTVGELRKLVKACEGPMFEDRRDMAIIMTFVDTGGRLAEIVNLRGSQVDLDTQVLRVTGKGDKARDLPIGANTVRALDRYERVRRQHPQAELEPYWLGRKGPAPRTSRGAILRQRGRFRGT
jgi:site-specific recombinase XerD